MNYKRRNLLYERRNLLYEFGKLDGGEEGTEQVGSQAVSSGTAAVGGGSEEAVSVQPTYSSSYSPLLYSGNQPYVGSGYAGGSDARPHLMTEWNYPHNFHQGSTGVSSGYMQQTSLCFSPLTLLRWNPSVTHS